jgi:hypothetical protein
MECRGRDAMQNPRFARWPASVDEAMPPGFFRFEHRWRTSGI